MRQIILFLLLISGATKFYGQTGNVGIGTNAPAATLHVKGTLRLEHPSQGAGKILRVYKDGDMRWEDITPLPVYGSFTGAGYSSVSNSVRTYNASITLPPGKWLVKVSLLITIGNRDYYESVRVSTFLSDTNPSTNATKTADYIPNSSTIMGGVAYAPNDYGMLIGSALINNSTTGNKTYYLHGSEISRKAGGGAAKLAYDRFTDKNWGENRIYALPIK